MQLRPEIDLSWRRAASTGLDPAATVDAHDLAEFDPSSRLRRAAGPVLDVVSEHLRDARYSLILADRDARIVDIRFGQRSLRPRLEAVGAVVGKQFTEATTGTNAIATVTELHHGVAVHGDEHYLESFKRFACHGVPVRDPITRRHAGVLDITCLAEDASPLLRPFLLGAVDEIQDSMLDQVPRLHRRVMAAFERACPRSGGPVVAFAPDLMLANDAATDLLESVDHAALQALGREHRPSHVRRLVLASGLQVGVLLERIDGGGLLVRLELPGRAAPVPRKPAARSFRDWHTDLRADLRRLRDDHTSVVVRGEPGTGRTTLASQLVAGGAVRMIDGPRLTAARVDEIAAELNATESDGGPRTLVLDDAHHVPDAVAAHLAQVVDDHALRLIMTTGPEKPTGALAACAARCPGRLDLAPLRAHRDRIPAFASAVMQDRSAGAVRLSPGAVRVLTAQDWAGNIRELVTVIGHAHRRRAVGDVIVADLPVGYRQAPTAPIAGTLRNAERDAIVRALAGCRGNKVHAAQQLGISRTTLYRRVRELHIDPDAIQPSDV